MNYTPSAEEAFASVEYIMRDVDYGWMLRYMLDRCLSVFRCRIPPYIERDVRSYKPRELI